MHFPNAFGGTHWTLEQRWRQYKYQVDFGTIAWDSSGIFFSIEKQLNRWNFFSFVCQLVVKILGFSSEKFDEGIFRIVGV